MKLGIVTYQIAQDMDVAGIIELCHNTGYQGVELRTTHAHKVEVNLMANERSTVKNQFEDAGDRDPRVGFDVRISRG